jgi:FkbM family methyltransferase
MKKILLLLLVVVALTLRFYPPARLSAWVLLGRNQDCPLPNALRSPQELKEQIAKKDEILHASRLKEKDPKGFRLYSTPDGDYWVPEGSEYSLPFNLAEQMRDIYGRDGNGVKEGDVVLDCGANVGTFVRYCLKRGAKKVIAIEPAPENIEVLRRNFVKEIAEGRVVVYPKGVWDKDDFLELHTDPHNSAADSFVIEKKGWGAVEKVPLTTIDKLVAELQLEKVDFVKMDIEGAEPNALQGGVETIRKFQPRLAISVYHQADHPKRVPQLVKQALDKYQVTCGPCAEMAFGVRPDILYFRP